MNGYSARVNHANGAGLLYIKRADYVQILRPSIEKYLKETVDLLQKSTFFSNWSTEGITRLFFCFERRKFKPGEDVVVQVAGNMRVVAVCGRLPCGGGGRLPCVRNVAVFRICKGGHHMRVALPFQGWLPCI